MASPNVRPRLAVLDVLPKASRDVIAEWFGGECDVAFAAEGVDSRELVRDATVILTMRSGLDATLIESTSDCRVIQKLGVGTDNIDATAAEGQGIRVLKAAGINADAVAELAVLLTLAVHRRLLKAVRESRAGRFAKEELRAESRQLVGRTVGLVGLGHVGIAAARRFAAFGTNVVYDDPYRRPPEVERDLGVRHLPLDELLATSDVVSLHLPGSPSAPPLIDAEVLARFKPGAVLINTARGSLVDEEALAAAVRSGHLLGAGLDVTVEEPLSAESPLFELDTVVVTPHIGGAVADNFPRVVERAYRNVTAVLAGAEPPPADVVV